MQPHSQVALVTIAALLLTVWTGVRTGRARHRSGIAAPAMTGDEMFERHVRVQANTLEWLPVFLVSLWLFAFYWSDLVATALGLVWLIGRLIYAFSYARDPKRRGLGFGIQALATLALLFGALGRVVWVMTLTGGA